MRTHLPEDNSLYESIADSIIYSSVRPTIADTGDTFYIVREIENGREKIGLIDKGFLYCILNDTTEIPKETPMIFVFAEESIQNYIYAHYGKDKIFKNLQMAKAYCAVHKLKIYYGRFANKYIK